MIESKRINIIIAVAICFALITSVLIVGFSTTAESSVSAVSEPAYAEKIFGVDIISLEIKADETEWQAMLDNASAEEYIMADVVVNGTTFTNVGVRPKGNSSLQQVEQTGSDRYSLRLQFNEYIKGQTCFGLESFVVNNMLGDYTYMKEYVSYDIMKTIDVNSPYFGFANITVNGDAWGFYLAVELYNDSYEERVFGDTSSMLYNVKSMEIGVDNDIQATAQPMSPLPTDQSGSATTAQITQSSTAQPFPPNSGGNDVPGRGGMGGSTGGSLAYSDDSSSSYSAIFDNVVGTGTEEDYQQVITALKALSTGTDTDIDKYFDVDEILRYLAAHTVVVNLDSYSSSMAQNYYICERDGEISILPWDYNLAWGGFSSTDSASVINFPIDTPVSDVEMSARPLLEKLFAKSEYLETYHKYLQEILDKYFTDGKFDEKINELNSLISEYVKNDKTAFCTYDQYQKAVASFTTLGNLRAESIAGQLDGTIPSTTAEQTANPEKLISADGLEISDLGSQSRGGNAGQTMPQNILDPGSQQDSTGNDTTGLQNGTMPAQPPPGVMPDSAGNDTSALQNGTLPVQPPASDMPDKAVMQQVMQILQAAGGTITDEVKAELSALGLTDAQIETISKMPAGGPGSTGGVPPGNAP